ncbi:DNA repair protein RAD2, putative [Trypanosoma cruzi marinkellei]|uniref:DNA repair protein RAD2, putative n=1 Tax=Trypanosoma cruzi marinkellei TaxID=85056 RepID=K2NSA4_TRYCR|nr:DNA repair protein RAD2, putative [Trypanosoma cruzi marinkellei]
MIIILRCLTPSLFCFFSSCMALAAVPRGYQVLTCGVMDTHRRVTLGQHSIASSRVMDLAFANATQTDASITNSFGLHLREPRIKRNYPRKVMCADDCDLMVSLMQKACPTFPPRAQEANDGEEDVQDETESQIYLKNLTRALDEALTRKRKPNLKSRSPPRDTATSWVESSHASTTSAPVEAERGALELWMEEQHRGQRITRSAEPFCKSRSLINAVSRGRFPDDANAPISEAVRKWEKEQNQSLQRHRHQPQQQRQPDERGEDHDEKTHRKTSLSSHEGLNGAPTLLGRLKQLPVRSWRLVHNLTRPPEPPVKDDSMPTGERPVDFMVVENWRHNFDYVGYEEQFNLDGLLSTRDFCRCIVTRHETSTTGKKPLAALADMFRKNRALSAARRREAQPCPNRDVLWSSVWMQRANEIALEKERNKLIDEIRAFELRVPAAARSKEAVEELQKDLVELLKKWPCDYMKRHVFTKINFVEWVRERQKMQSTVGTGALSSLSLAELMASRAEASFIEHVLALLPGDENSRVTRRPATAP